jgi:hypothetical protein
MRNEVRVSHFMVIDRQREEDNDHWQGSLRQHIRNSASLQELTKLLLKRSEAALE